jgi:hypothetical protein
MSGWMRMSRTKYFKKSIDELATGFALGLSLEQMKEIWDRASYNIGTYMELVPEDGECVMINTDIRERFEAANPDVTFDEYMHICLEVGDHYVFERSIYDKDAKIRDKNELEL